MSLHMEVPPQLSDEQEAIGVELIQPLLSSSSNGKPSVSVVVKNLVTSALKDVPFGVFVAAVVDEIDSVARSRLANAHKVELLLDDVKFCQAHIVDALGWLESQDETIYQNFKEIVSVFVKPLDGTSHLCRQWNDKGFFKQFRGAKKYEGMLDNYKAELARYK